jgi:hypothetical protein
MRKYFFLATYVYTNADMREKQNKLCSTNPWYAEGTKKLQHPSKCVQEK